MSSALILINATKIFLSEEYIKPEKFNREEFKAYYSSIVHILSEVKYTYYRFCSDYIITGNSEMTVEFVICLNLFEINRQTH